VPYLVKPGARVFYVLRGGGRPALALVHGWGGSHADWRPQLEYFSRSHMVLAPDLREHGRSRADAASSCTVENCAADLADLLADLALAQVVLVGHSLGCRVVLEAYLRARARVAGLVLIEGRRSAPGVGEAAVAKARQFLTGTGYRPFLQKFFGGMFLPGSDPELRRQVLARAEALDPEAGEAFFLSGVAWDARRMEPALSQVSAPLLVLQSTAFESGFQRRALHPGETTPWLELVRRQVPGARIEIISGPGHFVMREGPAQVNASLEAFLKRLEP